MDHIVTGALAVVRAVNGQNQTFYQGAIVPDGFGDPGHVKHLVGVGLLGKLPRSIPAPVVEAPPPPPAPTDADPGAGAGTGDGPPRPQQVAAKALWVDYAVARGMSREEAETMRKEDIIAAYPAEPAH